MGELCGIPLVLSHPSFLVVHKPAGLLSQPGLGPHQQDSLITRLQRGCQQLRLVHDHPRLRSYSLLLLLRQLQLGRVVAPLQLQLYLLAIPSLRQ